LPLNPKTVFARVCIAALPCRFFSERAAVRPETLGPQQ
jgi:hypothetical protein